MEQIIIDNKSYQIDDTKSFLDQGKEGAIYKLDETKCLKKLNPQSIGDTNKVDKILALCDKSDFFTGLRGFNHVGVPLSAAYSKDGFCGFSMSLFKDCVTINELRFDIFEQKYTFSGLTDIKVIVVIKQLFYCLQLLHNQKIILGDLNSNNIIWNPKTHDSYIIDIDSAQIGQFDCKTYKPEYLCPMVKKSGRNENGSFIFSMDSDIYALTIISFELLTGVHPFQIGLNPVLSDADCMDKNLSYLSFHHNNTYNIEKYKIAYKEGYMMIKKRLDVLRRNHKDIYNHFLTVFHYGKRRYYNHKTLSSVKKTRGKRDIKAIRSYKGNKQAGDPIELQLFLNNYHLNLSEIC